MGAPRLKRSSKRAWPPATALYTAIAAAALACGVWYAFPRSLAPSEDASNAGWRTDAEFMREVAAAGASCSFHRIDGKNLTKAAFEKLYREKEPVLLEGLLERWPATLEWTKPKLLHLYGERKMQTGSGSAIVYGGGSGGAGTTLRSRLEMMGSENYSVEDNIFTFDVSFFKAVPELTKHFSTPYIFHGFDNQRSIQYGSSWHIFSLGPSRTGLPFHVHGETWLGLVHGQKWWFIYPPGLPVLTPSRVKELTANEESILLNPLNSVWTWLRNDLPVLEKHQELQPLQCVQKAGEVPVHSFRRWKHLTVNIGDAVGVGGQAGFSAVDRKRLAAQVLQKNPYDVEAHHGAGLAHAHIAIEAREYAHKGQVLSEEKIQMHFAHAVEHFERAIELRPLNPEIHCLLAEVHASMADRELVKATLRRATSIFDQFAEKHPNDISSHTLASVYMKLARAYMLASLPADAIPQLEKALNLLPGSVPLFSDLANAYEMLGQHSAAEQIRTQLAKS